MVSKSSLSDRLPAHHPLKSLQTISSRALDELLPSIEASCSKFTGLPSLNVATVLKATLLQALYNISDPNQFIEHLRFNVLFRWFMGNLSREEQLSSASDYTEFQAKLLDNHSLSHFLDHVIRNASSEQSPNSAYIASNLSRWMNKHCPKEVFFREYRNAPVTHMSFTILFPPDRHPNFSEAVFYEYAKEDFPEKGTKKDNLPLEPGSVRSGKGRDQPVFYSANRQYYVTFLNAAGVSLSKEAPYENWDSYREKFERLIKHLKSSNSLAKPVGVLCMFSNSMRIPAGEELSDYFHVAPPQPPPIQIPRIMQESGSTYDFPRKLEETKSLTKMCYENDPALLLYSFQAHPQKEHVEVGLDLECVWTKPLSMDELPEVTSKLKEYAYIAFHSLITDKARRFFE